MFESTISLLSSFFRGNGDVTSSVTTEDMNHDLWFKGPRTTRLTSLRVSQSTVIVTYILREAAAGQ